MLHSDFRSARVMALAAAVAMLAFSAPCFAAGVSEEDVPETSVVPAEGPSGAAGAPAGSPSSMTPSAPAESGVMSAPAPTTKPHVHHAASGARAPEIEPAQ